MRRWPTVIIAALLAVVQADLWFGKGNMPYVMSLRKQLAVQQASNDSLRERNARVAAEVIDLKEGLEVGGVFVRTPQPLARVGSRAETDHARARIQFTHARLGRDEIQLRLLVPTSP